ncbi:MAG TPA: hypothetical protein VEG30_18335 [Terriglobales bacterium]|nr:hypothetical protein [Terriglobales bacterium]
MSSTPDHEIPAPRNEIPAEAAIESGGCAVLEYYLLALIVISVSWLAFLFYYLRGEILLYGDAVAHINIARRVFDSRTPGPLELGTVWLPLLHFLILPFVVAKWMWRTGVGGSIPSMIAHVASTLGIFRLVRAGLGAIPGRKGEARVASWLAALAFAANPNLLYLQSTAMTEPVYLAVFIWATLFFSQFFFQLYRGDDERAQRSLLGCGVLLLLGVFTRYDGWFAALVFGVAALGALAWQARRRGLPWMHAFSEQAWKSALLKFACLLAVGPAVWLVWNAAGFEGPLAFAIGPYSARTIERRTHKPGDSYHPGWKSPKVAAIFFVESAELNLAGNWETTSWQRKAWLWTAVLGSLLIAFYLRPLWPWLLLSVPLPFYVLSIAWGSVPIFLPQWWPYSYYNVRYGTQLVPAFVVLLALVLFALLTRIRGGWLRPGVVSIAATFVVLSYVSCLREVPICLREAMVNSRTRISLERKLAAELEKLPPDATVLMYTGAYSGALQRIGMPLRRTINETNRHVWEPALGHPAGAADFVVASEGDAVYQAVRAHPQGLEAVSFVRSEGQPPVTIYHSLERGGSEKSR